MRLKELDLDLSQRRIMIMIMLKPNGNAARTLRATMIIPSY